MRPFEEGPLALLSEYGFGVLIRFWEGVKHPFRPYGLSWSLMGYCYFPLFPHDMCACVYVVEIGIIDLYHGRDKASHP